MAGIVRVAVWAAVLGGALLLGVLLTVLYPSSAHAAPPDWDYVRFPANPEHVDVSGDWVVWSERAPSHDYNLYARNISGLGPNRLLASNADSTWDVVPRISGDRVVWVQRQTGHEDVFLYDLTGGGAVNLTGDAAMQRDASVEGSRVAWINESSLFGWEAWVYDLPVPGPPSMRAVNGGLGAIHDTALSGSRVVWGEGAVAKWYGVCFRDLATADPPRVVRDGSLTEWHQGPDISGFETVWSTFLRGLPPGEDPLSVSVAGVNGTPAPTELAKGASGARIAGRSVVFLGEDSSGGDTEVFVLKLGVTGTSLNLSDNVSDDVSPAVDMLTDGRCRVAWGSGAGEIIVATSRMPVVSFSDVTAGHDYYAAIRGLAQRGILNGYDVGRGAFEFRPGNDIWRAQFAKIIVGALGLPVNEHMTSPFGDFGVPDVADDLYPQEFVACAYINGITVGTSAATFGPWTPITRGQVVTMTVRALQKVEPALLDPVPPGFHATWGAFDPTHGPTAALAEHNGLLDGLPLSGAASNPWGAMPRGEVAQVVWNALQILE